MAYTGRRDKHDASLTARPPGRSNSRIVADRARASLGNSRSALMTLRDNIFMITCRARSGSTFLVHLLRSHPDICCHGEALVGPHVNGLWGRYQRMETESPAAWERLRSERSGNMERFVYKYVLDAQGRGVVGFKLKSDELVRPEYSQLKDIVQRDTDLAVIHLTRRNLLERYLSHYIAGQVTGINLVVGQEKLPEIPPVRLDPEACLADFELAREREAFSHELFAAHRQLDVVYEDLAAGKAETHEALCAFLGVEARPLNAATRKIVRAPLDEAIANFDELEAFFENTPYRSFFESGVAGRRKQQ